eukprot:2782558-Amphidinium_carterae.1
MKKPKAREAAVQEDGHEEEDEQTSPKATSEEDQSEQDSDQDQQEDEEASQEESSTSSMGAMAMVIFEDEKVQAHATKRRMPMFLDPAGKPYALADSGATNVTLNIKHPPEHLREEAVECQETDVSLLPCSCRFKD